MASAGGWTEEHFLLRVKEPRELAEQLNAVLTDEQGQQMPEVELNWTGTPCKAFYYFYKQYYWLVFISCFFRV